MSFWTEERREEVRRRWMEGQKAAFIASEMGAVSRNAVIGLINRMGLAGQRRKPPVAKIVRPRTHQRVRIANLKKAAPQPVASEAVVPGLVSFADLHGWHCKYPFGDRDFTYCGRAASIGPYCSDHARLCHTPAGLRAPRKDQVCQKVNF